jgi:hypothetical protein
MEHAPHARSQCALRRRHAHACAPLRSFHLPTVTECEPLSPTLTRVAHPSSVPLCVRPCIAPFHLFVGVLLVVLFFSLLSRKWPSPFLSSQLSLSYKSEFPPMYSLHYFTFKRYLLLITGHLHSCPISFTSPFLSPFKRITWPQSTSVTAHDKEQILNIMASLLVQGDPHVTLSIARIFRPLLVDLVARVVRGKVS